MEGEERDVLGRHPGLLVRRFGGALGDPALGRPGAQHGRLDHRGALVARVGTAEDRGGRAVGQRRAGEQAEGLGDQPAAGDVFAVDRRGELGPRVVAGVPAVLDRDVGEGVVDRAVAGGEVARFGRVGGHHDRAFDRLAEVDAEVGPRLDRGEGEAFVLVEELLGADRDGGLGIAGGDRHPGEVHRGAAGGAGVVDVDDRHAAEGDVAQRDLAADHLLAGDQPGRRVRVVDDVDLLRGQPGVGERRAQRLLAQRTQRAVHVTAEPRHPDAADGNLNHRLPPRSRAGDDPVAQQLVDLARRSGRAARRAPRGCGDRAAGPAT